MEALRPVAPRAIVSPYAPPLALPAPTPGPVDFATVSSPPPEPRGSLKDGLWKAARLAVVGTLAATTLIGAIAVVGNADAVMKPVTVSRPVQDVPSSPAQSTPHAPAPAPQMPTGPAGLVTVVRAPTVRRLAGQVEMTPRMQAELQKRLDQARASVEDQLQHLPEIQVEELIDVNAPLPTGDRGLLHVGGLSLPSGGMGQFQTEAVPLVVTGTIQPGPAHVRVEIAPHDVGTKLPTGPAGAVYVASFRTVVRAEADSVSVRGHVDVKSDLDGRATERALAEWKIQQLAAPAGSAQRAAIDGNVARLEARLAQARRLSEMAPSHHFGPILTQALADQGAMVSREVPMSRDVPLLDGVHHLWLAQGDNGQPRLLVTDSLNTPGIDGLALRGGQVATLPHAADGGWMGEKLNGAIRERVQAEIEAQLNDFSGKLPAEVRTVVGEAWSDATRQVEREGDGELRQAFEAHRVVTLTPGIGQDVRPIHLRIEAVGPTAAGDVAGRARIDAAGQRPSGDVSRFLRTTSLFPREVRESPAMVALSGDTLNTAMRDVREGGAVDWQHFLKDMAQRNHLRSLEFDRDEQGKLMGPQLHWQDGKPVIELELTAQSRGLLPLPIGALPSVPVVGEVAAPIGQVLDGIGSIVGGTIDALINPFPVVSIHLTIPVKLETRDGILTLRPDASGIKVDGPRGTNESLSMPLNLLQKLMGRILVGSGDKVAEKLRDQQVSIDLRDQGVRTTAAGAVAPAAGHEAPDLVFGVDPRVPTAR